MDRRIAILLFALLAPAQAPVATAIPGEARLVLPSETCRGPSSIPVRCAGLPVEGTGRASSPSGARSSVGTSSVLTKPRDDGRCSRMFATGFEPQRRS